MTKIDDLKGCFFPLTPRGIACLVGVIPWHYGTEYLTILYHTQPGAISEYLPAPLEPGPDPDLAYVAFSKWWSLSESQKDMAYVNPERTQYREAAIWASCSFQGQPAQICLHIWVDNDFSMARGWFMGFPKKLGEISITEYQPLNPIMPPLGIGSRMKGFVATHGERLIEGSLEVKRPLKPADLPKPIGLPVFHIRHFPSIVAGADPSVLELVKLGAENVHLGDIAWEGSGDLKFIPSEIEEHMDLAPREILGAYFYSSGYTFPGGEVVHDWL
jgi:acetoacetate decarboxylase